MVDDLATQANAWICTDLWRLYSILLAAGFKTHLTGGF
jgi:hypothetical protein